MRVIAMGLKVVVVLAAVAACALMARRIGPWKALGWWAIILGVLCAGVAFAVSRQSSGRVTILNYLMGYILQWGYRIGRGQLVNITAISWIIWMLLGGVGILATQVHANTFASNAIEPQTRGMVLMALLALAWIVDGAALFYILGNGIFSGGPARQSGTLWAVAAILFIMILGSVGLVIAGHSRSAALAALLLAGGPILLAGVAYAVFIVVILMNGKARWN